MKISARGAAALFAAAWLASLGYLVAIGRPLGDPIALAVIFGVALPGVAWLTTRSLPRVEPDLAVAGEGGLLLSLVLLVTLVLAVKGPIVDSLSGTDPRLHATVNTLFKLLVFAVVPLALYRLLLGRSPRELGLDWPPRGSGAASVRRSWLAFAVIGTILVAIQLLLGRGARPLLDGSLADRHWILGLLLAFVWMSVEAGVVEEIFFRVILQSRLAALTGSRGAGLWLAALVFGLAHAPGLALRGAGVVEGLGGAPSPYLAAAYSVTTMGVAALVFGVLWMRTRNWLLVVALHGLTDALSNTPQFMDVWGL